MNQTETNLPINNAIFLRRRGKVVPPAPQTISERLPLATVATMLKNVEALGYTFSPELFDACRALPQEQLVAFYGKLIADLKAMLGADHEFAPMYPNFPHQVMEMSEAELYLNAIVHYWSGGKLFPVSEVRERSPLFDEPEITKIGLGTLEEFQGIFRALASANVAFAPQDREDAAWFVEAYGDAIDALLPETIPQKENAAALASLLTRFTGRERAVAMVAAFMRTATDVLRLAVALSGGDISLAQPTKFRVFARPERALLLGLIDRLPEAGAIEDMLRWKSRWIRLGERLHPGEHRAKFPVAFRAFDVLRNDLPFATFNRGVEMALAEKNVAAALERLRARPGELARRLDHLLRMKGKAAGEDAVEAETEAIITEFSSVAERISTLVLLQVRQHFLLRGERTEVKPEEKQPDTKPALRVFFPKGSLAKAYAIEDTLPPLSPDVCARVVAACEAALVARFATLPPIGKVYVDPELANYMVPFGQRSASKSLRTLVRGSRLPLPPACNVLRFFVWWKNSGEDEQERADIDLSATLFDADFAYRDILSYYNLTGFGGVHSGDIVDAPLGASEFIDVDLAKVREAGIRYIVMTLHCFTEQPFVTLPECFAGWMARDVAGSGEIFEPKTVQDRLDLTADTRQAIPLVIDVTEGVVVWCDLALNGYPSWANNVHGNINGIAATLQSMATVRRANLFDLFRLHATARGEMTQQSEGADTVFSVAAGTPFQLDEIASGFML